MKRRNHLIRGAFLPVILVLALLAFLTALSNFDRDRNAQGQRQLEESLRRSAVACYAAEGIYPPDLDYLEDHYGLQIDEDRYAVHYEIFGSNLMPSITVLGKGS